MRISDWSSDVCSSDLSRRSQRHADAVEQEGEGDVLHHLAIAVAADLPRLHDIRKPVVQDDDVGGIDGDVGARAHGDGDLRLHQRRSIVDAVADHGGAALRSEEHTSELQSLMRISYAVFCLKKK